MSFAWQQYLRVAKELAQLPTSPASEEARLRTALSRIYYTAFCEARNYLRDFEKDANLPSDGEAHTYIPDKFKGSPDKKRKDIGEKLSRLKTFRLRADYDDNFYDDNLQIVDRLTRVVRVNIQLAQDILNALDSLRKT